MPGTVKIISPRRVAFFYACIGLHQVGWCAASTPRVTVTAEHKPFAEFYDKSCVLAGRGDLLSQVSITSMTLFNKHKLHKTELEQHFVTAASHTQYIYEYINMYPAYLTTFSGAPDFILLCLKCCESKHKIKVYNAVVTTCGFYAAVFKHWNNYQSNKFYWYDNRINSLSTWKIWKWTTLHSTRQWWTRSYFLFFKKKK